MLFILLHSPGTANSRVHAFSPSVDLARNVLPSSLMDYHRSPYGDLDSHLGGRRVSGEVGCEWGGGHVHTPRGDDTRRDDSKAPLSKAFSERLTDSAPTVFALETARPREISMPSLSRGGAGRGGGV